MAAINAANDPYNPDNFDWGDGDSGIHLDDVGPNVVEEAVQAALAVHEEAFGWARLRREDVKQTAGRVFKPKHVVPVDKRAFFENEWPEFTFVWDAATNHHDHPVSHLATELNELEMVHDLVANRQQYIDLFGNPHRNRKYKRLAIAAYQMSTPKDYLRYQYEKAGMVALNWQDLVLRNGVYSGADTITCTHALYYLTMDKIGELVNRDRRTRLRALVHRHEFTHGFLNAGEQEYWVSQEGTVTQKNVLTGEVYHHPSLEALFHQFSAKTTSGGVAWTVKKAGGDSFYIEFVGCPNSICDEFTRLKSVKPESRSVTCTAGVTVTKFLHWTWTSLKTTGGSIILDDVDLLDKLKRYCAGKPRNPRLRTETLNYARRLCNKADIISIHGGGAHEIPVARMVDYVHAAFYADVQHELEVALHYHRENQTMVAALNAHYEGTTTTKDFARLQAAFSESLAITKWVADAVVGDVVAVDVFDPDPQHSTTSAPFSFGAWAG